jgi:5-methyltetrahydrofolate--homocysteine methyltransferase
MDIERALRERDYLISDGAMGTMLQARGLRVGACPELWNAERPDDVLAVHTAYIEAGAELLTTNSFGGSRHKLAQYGAECRADELNAKAVEIARRAAGGDAAVVGSIGPLGVLLEPYGDLTAEDAAALYGAHAEALASAGADALLFETFYDAAELAIAVKSASGLGVPALATMTFDSGGRTMMGTSPAQAWEAVAGLGLLAFGANCSTGPDEMLPIIEALRAAGAGALIAQPNAGLPETAPDGTTVYGQSPESFGEYAPAFVAAGCKIVGGCCGSTPPHIRSIRAALQGGE